MLKSLPRYLPLLAILSAPNALFDAILVAQTKGPSLMNAMDHGPFVSSTISRDPMATREIVAYKGIAVRVGDDRDAVMVFDTDLLRVATAWTGGFLKWYPARDGLQEFPSPDGYTHFETGQRPGWSRDGKFSDSRGWKYGPIPKQQGAYKGLYLNGNRVVFSYSIGSSEILEMPGFERIGEASIFTRSLQIENNYSPLHLRVLQSPDGSATKLEVTKTSQESGYVSIQTGGQSRLVGFQGLPPGAQWRLQNRHLVLQLPELKSPARFDLSIGPVLPNSQTATLAKTIVPNGKLESLEANTKPGAAQWDPLKTTIKTTDNGGPFAVDELTAPSQTPWNSYLRFSGVDFLSDGRAVVTSLSGEVWIVDGLGKGSKTLTWKRYATGLNQPHGVKVVNDKIYVTARDQVSLLHDRNGDSEADFYENFNNEVMAATNFHAFTMNLDTDSKGNFYFAKATPWPPVSRQGVAAEVTPHHGVLFRMPPDGSRLDVIASGLRNPNGLSIGPEDEIVYSDNEGNWAPTSKVHRIRQGGFHGFMPSAQSDSRPNDFVKPIVWVPHFVDNSPSAPTFIESDSWPEELQGHLLVTSYGRGSLALVLKEEVDGEWQGARLTLPLNFRSGLIHSRFADDGHLYLSGLTSWQSVGHGGDWGSFHRVRYTGRPLELPVATHAKKQALEIRFSDPLDPSTATDPRNYRIEQWTYPWTSQYGTRGKVFSARNPGAEGADNVIIESIQLSEDGKTVTLEIPELRQSLADRSLGQALDLPEIVDTPLGLVMAIDYTLKTATGSEMKHTLHQTIHRVAGDESSASPSHSHHTPLSSPSASPSPSASSPSSPLKTRASPPPMDANTHVIDIQSTGIALTYDVTEIRMKTGERIVIRYDNASDMAHNIVVVKSEADINPVGLAGIMAQSTEFIPESESDRILAYSSLANPGDTVYVDFTAPGPGVYPFICTFSGHFTIMQGRIIVE